MKRVVLDKIAWTQLCLVNNRLEIFPDVVMREMKKHVTKVVYICEGCYLELDYVNQIPKRKMYTCVECGTVIWSSYYKSKLGRPPPYARPAEHMDILMGYNL